MVGLNKVKYRVKFYRECKYLVYLYCLSELNSTLRDYFHFSLRWR